jgi:hypothetical protein
MHGKEYEVQAARRCGQVRGKKLTSCPPFDHQIPAAETIMSVTCKQN